MRKLQRFVGIDWSGAEGQTQRGIQVAEFNAGEGLVKIKRPPTGEAWSRAGVLEVLDNLDDRLTLVGMDFGFSLPWPHEGVLFNSDSAIVDAATLWNYVDSLCCDNDHFYAGAVWKSEASEFRKYIYHHASHHRGEFYCPDRLRRCETESMLRPISIYHMTGAQVGAGSFSGMRVLNAIRKQGSNKVAIWPFDQIGRQPIVLVEIYPSLFYSKKDFRRGCLNKSLADNEFFAKRELILKSYGVIADPSDRVRSVDAVDAMVSAAALAELSADETYLTVPAKRKALVQREGWIFGVPLECGKPS